MIPQKIAQMYRASQSSGSAMSVLPFSFYSVDQLGFFSAKGGRDSCCIMLYFMSRPVSGQPEGWQNGPCVVGIHKQISKYHVDSVDL